MPWLTLGWETLASRAVSPGAWRPAAARSCRQLQLRTKQGWGAQAEASQQLPPPAQAARGRETPPRPLLGPTSTREPWDQAPQRQHGAGRGRSHRRAPPQCREGAGWVLAWARMQRDPLPSPAANAKSIRHVSAPRGNRLRPVEGSSQGSETAPWRLSPRWEAGDVRSQSPERCRRAPSPTAAGSLLPSAGPVPGGLRGPGGSGREGSDLPTTRMGSRGLPALAAPLLAPECWKPGSQQTAHPRSRQSHCLAPSGHPWG